MNSPSDSYKYCINIYGKYFLSATLDTYETTDDLRQAKHITGKKNADDIVDFLAKYHNVTAYKFEI